MAIATRTLNRAERRAAVKAINAANPNPTKSPIPLSTLTKRGFIEADRVAMDNALPESNFPWLFGNEANGVIHKGRKILNIEDIETGSELERYTAQAPRTGVNPQYSAIRNDIMGSGYSLTELPISVRYYVDDEGREHYVILDGRTRLEILDGLGVKSVIVDIFEIEKNGDAIRISQVYNRYRKPYGEGSITDVEECIVQLGEENALGLPWSLKNVYVKDPVELKKRLDVTGSVITKEANALSNNKLKPDQITQIYANVLNKFTKSDKTILIRKFNNGGSVALFSEGLGHVNNELVMVKHFSGTEQNVGKLAELIYNQREWLAADPKRRLHILLYCGKPNPTDPEGSWKKATVGSFMTKWLDFKEWTGIPMGQVQVLGAIPQIRSLNETYPMHKIHYFD